MLSPIGGEPSGFSADAQVARGAALFPVEDGIEARLYLPPESDAPATGPTAGAHDS